MARETSAFERQVLPHLDAAYNLARWLVRDPSAADDVVQEAMLRALRYHAGLRGEAKPWLLQIVRNVAYATMSKNVAFATMNKNVAYATMTRRGADPVSPEGGDAADIADPADDPEAALARDQGMRQLDRRLAALPAELRECLVLRELEELSYKEIAQVTGVAIGTVMSRLWRARQALLESAR